MSNRGKKGLEGTLLFGILSCIMLDTLLTSLMGVWALIPAVLVASVGLALMIVHVLLWQFKRSPKQEAEPHRPQDNEPRFYHDRTDEVYYTHTAARWPYGKAPADINPNKEGNR